MKTLTIKELAPYLPYGLKLIGSNSNEEWEMEAVKETGIKMTDSEYWMDIYDFKPLLRPLSDLTEEIIHNGEKFVPIERIKEYHPWKTAWTWGFNIEIDDLNVVGFRTPESWLPLEGWFPFMGKFFEWHFDVFGLIDKGLAKPLKQ